MSTKTFVDTLVERVTLPPSRRLSVGFRTAARLTGLGESTLRRHASNGKLATKKIGSRRVVSLSELERLVSQ
jgi:excisionase family DNA binding protein